MPRLGRRVVLASLVALAIFSVGCKKQPVAVATPPPPPPAAPPPPPRPTATLQAAPTTVQSGQPVTLTWSSSNATSVNLAPGVGNVALQGSTTVTPQQSVTYTLTATGPGGSADATARVTVTPPPPPPPPAAQPSLDELFTKNVKDAYFDYDKADIRPDAREALSQTAQFLRQYPQIRITIEGHCDERGSTEYNLALGDRRAQATKDFLASLGISADRMETVSYGKERPVCTEHEESCWQQNRRGHPVRK